MALLVEPERLTFGRAGLVLVIAANEAEPPGECGFCTEPAPYMVATGDVLEPSPACTSHAWALAAATAAAIDEGGDEGGT